MQNITELRNELCENYTKMKDGKMGIKLGKELTNAAGKIINSLRVEMEYYEIMGINNEIPFLEKKKTK